MADLTHVQNYLYARYGVKTLSPAAREAAVKGMIFGMSPCAIGDSLIRSERVEAKCDAMYEEPESVGESDAVNDDATGYFGDSLRSATEIDDGTTLSDRD